MKKQRAIAFIVLLAMIISIFSVNVSALKNGDEIGNVLYTNIKTYVDNYRIPSYNINNKSAVILNDLANYGFNVVYDNKTRTSTVTHNPNKAFTPITQFDDLSDKPSGTVAFKYVYTDIKAVVNGRVVESFNIKGYLAIFFEDLKDFGTFSYVNATRESRFVSNKPITGISLDRFTATVKVNESLRLNATIVPSTVADKTVTWTSSNINIAQVDSNGTVTGISAGTATITATASNGLYARCTVTVEPTGIAVTGITLDRSTATLKLNEFGRLNATVTPSTATDKTVTWSSSNTNVAQVLNGYVLGVSTGTVTITATAANGLYARCTVTVNATGNDITEIRLDRYDTKIKVNESFKLTATIYPTTAADRTVTWSSSNSNVATVDTAGNVRGINVGTATITAMAANGFYARCTVTVESAGVAVTNILLDKSSDTVKVGEYTRLVATVTPTNATDTTVTWSSSNTSVARVVDGYVLGATSGNATITAKSSNGYTSSCYVTVTAASVGDTGSVTGISLTSSPTTLPALAVGDSFTLSATVSVSPTSSTIDKSVTWKSSSPNVAIVDNGNNTVTVKCVGAGNNVTITATSIYDKSRYVSRTINIAAVPIEPPVSNDVNTITLNSTKNIIKVGGQFQLTAEVLPSTAPNKALTWSSSDTSVATVDSYGYVVGTGVGSAVITAKSVTNNIMAYCLVIVEALPVEPT